MVNIWCLRKIKTPFGALEYWQCDGGWPAHNLEWAMLYYGRKNMFLEWE